MATANIYDLTDIWNAGGTTFSAIKMNVTNTASAAGSLLMDLQMDSLPVFTVGKDKSARIYATFTDASNYERFEMSWNAGGYYHLGQKFAGTGATRPLFIFGAVVTFYEDDSFSNRATVNVRGLGIVGGAGAQAGLSNPSDGVLTLTDNNGTSFGRMQFGGTTSSYPAIKRSTTKIHVRLADDSAFAELVYLIPTSNPGPGTLWNNAGTLAIGT